MLKMYLVVMATGYFGRKEPMMEDLLYYKLASEFVPFLPKCLSFNTIVCITSYFEKM